MAGNNKPNPAASAAAQSVKNMTPKGPAYDPSKYSTWELFKSSLTGNDPVPMSQQLSGKPLPPVQGPPSPGLVPESRFPKPAAPPPKVNIPAAPRMIQDNAAPLGTRPVPNVMAAPVVAPAGKPTAAPKPITPAPSTAPTGPAVAKPSAPAVAPAPSAASVAKPTAGYTPTLNVPKTLGAGPLVPSYDPMKPASPNFGLNTPEQGFPDLPNVAGAQPAAAPSGPPAPVSSFEEGLKQLGDQAGAWWQDTSKNLGDIWQRAVSKQDALGGQRPLSWILAGLAQMADKQGQPGTAAMNVLGKMEDQFNNLAERQVATGEKNATTQAKHTEYTKQIADIDAKLKDRQLSQQDRQFYAELKQRLQMHTETLAQDADKFAWSTKLDMQRLQIEATKNSIALRQLTDKQASSKIATALAGAKLDNIYGAGDGEMQAASGVLKNLPGLSGAKGKDGKPVSMFTEFMQSAVGSVTSNFAQNPTGTITSAWDNKTQLTQGDYALYSEALSAVKSGKQMQLSPEQTAKLTAVRKDLDARVLFMAQQTYRQLVPVGSSDSIDNKAGTPGGVFNYMQGR